MNFQKNVSFTDADGKLVFVEISVKDGRLSMTGHTNGSGGQIHDIIKPADDTQADLLAIWKQWHLNNMHAGTEAQETALNSQEFEEFKVKIQALLDQANDIKKIVFGSLKDYKKFIGVPQGFASPGNDQRALQNIWQGGKSILVNSSYRTTTSLSTYIESIPIRLRPEFNWNSHVPPNEVHELFSSNYDIQCAFLESKKLLTDNGYKYGTSWLTRELPEDICERLEELTAKLDTFTGSPHEKQANDLLKLIGVVMEATFQKHDRHFPNDEHTRDIYGIRFYRADSKRDYFTLTFGQSITNSDGKTPPTAYDVVACLTKSDPGDFENFCQEFGYDTDSRIARTTWRGSCQEWKKVSGFFTEEEIEKLLDIA